MVTKINWFSMFAGGRPDSLIKLNLNQYKLDAKIIQ